MINTMSLKLFLKLSLFLLSFIVYCESSNILYVIPYAEKSHYIMLRPIGLELARRGHNVSVITTYKETDYPPNYHQIVVDDNGYRDDVDKTAYGKSEGKRFNLFDTVDMTFKTLIWELLFKGGLALTEKYLDSTQFQTFLAQDNKFDLVISEEFAQEAFHVLAYKYNAPLVLVTTFGNCMQHNIITGNPTQLATVVYEWADVEDPTSFIGRLKNVYISYYVYFWWKYWYLDGQEQLAKKYIRYLQGPVPSLYELQRNTSLLLINGHFSFDPPTAYLPNIVEIGGAHLSRSDTPLPDDLKKILDEAKHGVIYVSFGSNIRSSELPDEKRNAFLKVFGRLKQTVLWKWEDDKLENKPENLVTRKWFPQKDILAHPNIKVFISHGGLIGTQEAIFNGVPIIGIPICADQANNLILAQEKGIGKIIRYHDINEKNVEDALLDVLKDDAYLQRAHELSIAFRDRPLGALDTAMFWIEYVIRHKGAKFMRNPALDLSWIASNMLDLYAFILFVMLSVIFVIVKVISTLKGIVVTKQMKEKSKKKRL